MAIMRRICLLLLAFLCTSPAMAFWDYGHRTIATIALAEVKPRTRASIAWLLKRQAVLETPTCPVRTIEEAAVWPDCVKPLGDRFAYMYPWHYQDIDVCAPFDVHAACPDGNCASVQIARAQRMLADRALPVRDRLTALALLVHITGDIHQPLHVGEAHDKGGNDVKARYGAISGRTNLHGIWDGLLAERAISSPPSGPAGLLADTSAAVRKTSAEGSVEDWMRESWMVARDKVYPTAVGDVCGRQPGGKVRGVLDNDAIAALVPVMRAQVLKGGLRLARLLDGALDGDHPEVAHPPRSAATATN